MTNRNQLKKRSAAGMGMAGFWGCCQRVSSFRFFFLATEWLNICLALSEREESLENPIL